MSTQSTTDFEWSVTICDVEWGIVGIASQLIPQQKSIRDYDQNAIVLGAYRSQGVDLPTYNPGDVIRFRFQPQRKKLVIDLEVS